jgi:hypothetical protein
VADQVLRLGERLRNLDLRIMAHRPRSSRYDASRRAVAWLVGAYAAADALPL